MKQWLQGGNCIKDEAVNNEELCLKWLKRSVGMLLFSLLFVVVLFFVFDPYFHFHGPISGISYRLYEERYINDGISRNFEFDTLVTGTSMAQNFKTSEVENLFGGVAVKETFSGSGFQETSENIDRALQRNKELKTIIWSCEYNGFIRAYDWTDYEGFPTYLYDDDPFNDVSYIFNKSIAYHGLFTNVVMTLKGEEPTSMDDYSAWESNNGLDHILLLYDRENVQHDLPSELTLNEQEMVRENIQRNLIDLFKKYPEVTFYLFYTPYSICYWDSLVQMDTLERQFSAEKIATELILECPNVRLYSFFDKHDIITNLDYYRDKEHYDAEISSEILKWMARGDGLITKENYLRKMEDNISYYSNYDYDSIYR